MDEQATLQRILTLVGSVFDAYSAVLFLPQGKSGDYVIAAAFSLGEHVIPQASLKATKGVAGWIIKNQKPLLINNLERKKARLGYYDHDEEAHIKAFMGCPLAKGGGALCLDSKRTYSFSDKDQKVLNLFAELIQEVAEQSRMVAYTSSSLKYHAAIKQILILRKKFNRWPQFLEQLLLLTAEVTGFDYCFLVSRSPEGDTFALEGSSRPLTHSSDPVEFDIHTGLLGWVFKNNTPVFAGEDDSKGVMSPLFGKEAATPPIQSAICVPIHFQRSTKAVLCLAHESAMVLAPPLKDFALMAAEYLTIFLESLYLKTQLHQPGNPDRG